MKPLLELVEDYGEACYEHGRLGADFGAEEAYDKAGELLTEIRQRIESDAERLAGLELDAARAGELLTAARKAVLALAHAATLGPMYNDAYEALSTAIDAAMAEGE